MTEREAFLAIEAGKTLINEEGSLIYSLEHSVQNITLNDINKDRETGFDIYPGFYLDFTIMKDEDVEPYKICGMSKINYDTMVNDHIKANEIAFDDYVSTGEFKKQYTELCISSIENAIERHGTQFLLSFSTRNNTEELLWNFFEDKNNKIKTKSLTGKEAFELL